MHVSLHHLFTIFLPIMTLYHQQMSPIQLNLTAIIVMRGGCECRTQSATDSDMQKMTILRKSLSLTGSPVPGIFQVSEENGTFNATWADSFVFTGANNKKVFSRV